MTAPSADRTGELAIACVGGGLIGSAWAALFAARGFRVRVYDPSAAAEATLRVVTDDAAETLDVCAQAMRDRLSFTTDLAAAVAGAAFVQESAPESLVLKQRLFAEIERVAPETAIIASSTSDFPISLIQEQCSRPERTLVGHPINPPYSAPLVEVVGSPLTSRETIDRACALYRAIGKRPLVLDREVTGFVANRLQMAVAREALQLVARGEATIRQVDDALMDGVGPRFAAVGLFGGYILNLPSRDAGQWLDHLAEFDFGEGLVHSGPIPDWSEALRSRIAAQWRERVETVGAEELRRMRDALVCKIARLQEAERDGGGAAPADSR